MSDRLLIALTALVAALVLGGAFTYSLLHSASVERDNRDKQAAVTQSRIDLCELVKRDRVDNARAWTRGAKTWTARVTDPSISPSERQRADITARIYRRSAAGLRSRLYECTPLVKTGEHVIDKGALADARGEL